MERKTMIIIGGAVGFLLLVGIIIGIVVIRRNALEEGGVIQPGGSQGTTVPGGTGTTGTGTTGAPERVIPSSEARRIMEPHTPPPGAVPADPKTFVDRDNDGLSNSEEQKLGTDPDRSDTDGDTLLDGDEVNSLKTDPLVKNPPSSR